MVFETNNNTNVFEVNFYMYSMIPCSADCVYQTDGYCTLETPAIVTNISNHGCVHRIQLKRPVIQNNTHINQLPLQTPPSHVLHQ